MKWVEYTDSDILWMDLANKIAGELTRGLMQHERVSLVVPGGTTPGPVYDVLSVLKLDWDRVDILLSDERWVPETSPRSNAALVRQHLLKDRAEVANFIPYYSEEAEPEAALEEVGRTIVKLMPFTLVLLGMGTNMHTASLFPEGDNMARALAPGAPVLLPMRAPDAEELRVTLSAEALNGAMQKHLVILGEEKRDALRQAEAIGDPMRAPIAALLDGLTVHWAKD